VLPPLSESILSEGTTEEAPNNRQQLYSPQLEFFFITVLLKNRTTPPSINLFQLLFNHVPNEVATFI
jgi:hypothetical protein